MDISDEGLRESVAQLWCLPQHEHKEMDVEFAMSIVGLLQQVRDETKEKAAKVADGNVTRNGLTEKSWEHGYSIGRQDAATAIRQMD